MKIFKGSTGTTENRTSAQQARRPTRRSSGLTELTKLFESEESLCILDLGATSPANIRYFTERGHKIYSENLLVVSADPIYVTKDESGNPIPDSKRFLSDNLVYQNATFDVVLCWNMADYMDEGLVKPAVAKLWSLLKPGGMLLAFFHTKEAGPDAPCYRYHIVGVDTLEMQPIDAQGEMRRHSGTASSSPAGSGFRLQRVFNNRHIENLFHDFASIKFFLSRDNVREVLVVR